MSGSSPVYPYFRHAAMLVPVLLAVQCLSMDRKIFEQGCAKPRRTEQEIVTGYAIPLARHHYLGEITIQYGSGYERQEILRRLRVEAAHCGADGILLGSFSRVDSKWRWADKNVNDSFDTSGYRLIVTLYRFDDEPVPEVKKPASR